MCAKLGPVWRLWWDGERKRLGLPPLPRKEDDEEEGDEPSGAKKNIKSSKRE